MQVVPAKCFIKLCTQHDLSRDMHRRRHTQDGHSLASLTMGIHCILRPDALHRHVDMARESRGLTSMLQHDFEGICRG